MTHAPIPAVGSAPAPDGVLVRFGEIGIKSAPVRRSMLSRLQSNLQSALLRRKIEGGVELLGPRLWMRGPDAQLLAKAATEVFGVVSVSPAWLASSDMASMQARAAQLALAHPTPWQSFAIRAKREGNHPYSSQDVGIQCGSAIVLAAQAIGRPAKVDLTKPDLEVHVDVRDNRAFLFTQTLPGAGGIPVGTQGNVIALLSDESSALAAWLAMRRGCRVIALHAGDTGSLPIDAATRLAEWGMHHEAELLPVCSGTVSKPALLDAAAKVAASRRAVALVTGDTLSSQLVAPAGIPVLRPVCGLDPAEAKRWLAHAGLVGMEWPANILDPASRETVDTLLSMRRTASL